MKKTILIVVLCAALFLLSACSELSPEQSSDNSRHIKGIITWGTNGVYKINVSKYIRDGHGWIVITTTDGRKFSTDQRNVLIMEE